MHPRYAARVFATAGIFNAVVGTAALVAPLGTARLLGLGHPPSPLLMALTGWLVLVFGVGYGLTALHPERNRDLMLVGGLGKVLILPLMVMAWRRGDVGLSGVIAGAGDFVFAVLFFDALGRAGRQRVARDGARRPG